MPYDNIFWVLMAPTLASCVCFAFEMSCNFVESWNTRFGALCRGFETLRGKTEAENIHVSFKQVPASNYAGLVVLVKEQKRRR